jgi:c-di-GMP-binding flagellar brake protein YcgR
MKPNEPGQSSAQIKTGTLAIEKRRYPRYSVELPLGYSHVDGKEIYGGIVANASEGGVLIYLPERVELGVLLKIEILYAKDSELDKIEAVGKVVWVDLAAKESSGDYRYGLQFQSITESDFDKLVALLREAVD